LGRKFLRDYDNKNQERHKFIAKFLRDYEFSYFSGIMGGTPKRQRHVLSSLVLINIIPQN